MNSSLLRVLVFALALRNVEVHAECSQALMEAVACQERWVSHNDQLLMAEKSVKSINCMRKLQSNGDSQVRGSGANCRAREGVARHWGKEKLQAKDSHFTQTYLQMSKNCVQKKIGGFSTSSKFVASCLVVRLITSLNTCGEDLAACPAMLRVDKIIFNLQPA